MVWFGENIIKIHTLLGIISRMLRSFTQGKNKTRFP